MVRPPGGSSRSLMSPPPPSYHTFVPNGYTRSLTPVPYELEDENRWYGRRNTIKILGIYLFLFLGITAFIIQIANLLSPHPKDPLDPMERERVREEWRLEIERHQHELHNLITEQNHERNRYEEEHERKRKQWWLETKKTQQELHELVYKRDQERMHYEKEHERYVNEKEQREDDRQRHEAEKRRWKEELERQLGQLWSQPQGDRHCAGYDRREYTATLDPYTACMRAPIMIHDKPVFPTSCEASTDGSRQEFIGHWTVDFDEPDCRPHWANWNDKGCVWNSPDGKHRVESRLWEIRKGDSWEKMCSTTPAEIGETHFDCPTRCENRGARHGMVGIFEWSDIQCKQGVMGNLTKKDGDKSLVN